MSKRLGGFIEKFTIMFLNGGKSENEPDFEFEKL